MAEEKTAKTTIQAEADKFRKTNPGAKLAVVKDGDDEYLVHIRGHEEFQRIKSQINAKDPDADVTVIQRFVIWPETDYEILCNELPGKITRLSVAILRAHGFNDEEAVVKNI